MRLSAYLRVSRVKGREGDSFLSPDQQRTAIERFAEAHGHEIVSWHEDLDQSGGTMDRPAFNAMLAEVEAGQVDGVICAKLDRFARSLIGALEAIRRLDDAGATFIAVQEGFDPSTPYGKAFMSIALIFAELELDRIKQGWRATLSNVILDRGIQPTIAPFGYRKTESKVLEPSDESSFVVGIYERRIKGDSWAVIARWLNESGAKPRRAKQWSGRAVKDLITNEIYLGTVHKGDLRREQAHPALVSNSTWLAAQDVFVRGTSPQNGTGFALRSLVRCAGCSYTMSSGGYKPKRKPRVPQYHCKVVHGSGTCSSPANINQNVLLPFVTEQFFAKISTDFETRPMVETPALDEAHAALQEAELRLSAYRDDLEVESVLGRDSYLLGMRSRVDAVSEAQEALQTAKRSASGVDLPAVDDLRAIWTDLSLEERRQLFGSAIEAIFVRRGRAPVADRARIVWKGEAVAELSRIGKSVPVRSFDW